MLSSNKMCISDDKKFVDEEYLWVDFMIEFNEEFETLEELCEAFIPKYNKVLAKIEYGNGFCLKKDTTDSLLVRCPKMPTLDMKYYDMRFAKGKPIKTLNYIKLTEIVSLLFKRLPIYSSETFKPMNHNLKKYEYNSWCGFKGDVTDFKMDMTYVNPILDFIKTIICSGNDEVYTYFLSWLRHITVKPYMKTGVAVFLHSDEKGTGKGTIGYWLKNFVFGNGISSVVNGLSKITQKHNACIQRKIFVMVDEMPSTQGEFHSQFDTMKHLITDPELTIEPKGIDPYEIPNMANFLMMSNNRMSLKIEKGDRRYACFEVSPSKKLDEEYWDIIHNETLTEETGKHFFQYLKQLPEAECVSLRRIPNTELRNSIIDNSIPSHERFFQDIKSGDYTIADGYYMDGFNYKDKDINDGITAEMLYKLYEAYCLSRKESCLRFRLFFCAIKSFVVKRTNKINNKVINNYSIV